MSIKMKESKSSVTIRRRTHRIPTFLGFRTKSSLTAVDEQQDLSDDDESDAFAEHKQFFLAGPRMIRMIVSSQKTLFWSLVAFRLLNALMIQTSYVPDEYWQSIEVAHRMAFGYGYLTWEWHSGLRGYTYPAMFAVVYKLLGFLHMDSRTLITKFPKLLQGLFAGVGDFYVFRLSLRLSGARTARWTLLFQLTSWFNFYCCTRTLTNSMEAVLTAVALYYYPWPGKTPSCRKIHWQYVTLVSLAVVVRPTSAIVWFPLCALHLWHVVASRRSLWRLLQQYICRGLMVLLLSVVVDWICYGQLVNVYYNFLEFNFLSDLGSFYGTHPWHWYLTQGLVVLLGTHMLPLLYAVWKGTEPHFLAVIAWTLFIYSLLSHKEFRFLMGLLPLVMHVCGCTTHQLLDVPSIEPSTAGCNKHEHQSNNSLSRAKKESHVHWKTFVLVCLIAVNLPIALYTCLIHQRGTIDVMTFLYAEAQKPVSKDLMNVLFLMPCHSTPFYSYIHRNVTMAFLTCEPNLGHISNYTDEADMFYNSPEAWLAANNFNSSASTANLPTHVVMFDELHVRLAAILRDSRHGYRLCGRFFHTHFPEGRVSMYVVALCSTRWIQALRQHSSSFFRHS